METLTLIDENGYLYLAKPQLVSDFSLSLNSEKSKIELENSIEKFAFMANPSRRHALTSTGETSCEYRNIVPVFRHKKITKVKQDERSYVTSICAPVYNTEVPGKKTLQIDESGSFYLVPAQIANPNSVPSLLNGQPSGREDLVQDINLGFSCAKAFGYPEMDNNAFNGVTMPSFWFMAVITNTNIDSQIPVFEDVGSPMYIDSNLSNRDRELLKLKLSKTGMSNGSVCSRFISQNGSTLGKISDTCNDLNSQIAYYYYLVIPEKWAKENPDAGIEPGAYFPPASNIYDDCHICMGGDGITSIPFPYCSTSSNSDIDAFIHGYTLFSVSGSNSDLLEANNAQANALNRNNQEQDLMVPNQITRPLSDSGQSAKIKAMNALYSWDANTLKQKSSSDSVCGIPVAVRDFIKNCSVVNGNTRIIEAAIASSYSRS